MAGYNYDAGMSWNATFAYDCGRKPLSKITLDDLRGAGWTETKKLALGLAETGLWRTDEWHQSGGSWYNRVWFYDPARLVQVWNDLDENARADARANAIGAIKEKTAPVEEIKVRGTYPVWGGSRRRPRIEYHKSFEGVLRGNWIILPTGSKKKATGNGVVWEKVA